MNNPFLESFETPFEAIPFDKIKLEHYKPALEFAIIEGKKEIDTIKSDSETANFENTFAALERSGQLIGKITSVFFNLNSANTSDEMQSLAQEISPMLTIFYNEIQLDLDLFKRVKAAYDNTDANDLDGESAWMMEKTYKSFVRNGANLNDEDKESLKAISTELSTLSLSFFK